MTFPFREVLGEEREEGSESEPNPRMVVVPPFVPIRGVEDPDRVVDDEDGRESRMEGGGTEVGKLGSGEENWKRLLGRRREIVPN